MNQGMPCVWESAPTLREMISKQREGRKSIRLQLLYLLATKQATSRTSAAQHLGVERETVGHWLSKYERGGLDSLLEIGSPPGLPASLPDFVITAMRLKLQEPAGLSSFKALQSWVEQSFQLKTSYRVIHYTATKVLGARLAVGRRSHVKKKRGMRKRFALVFKLASDWQSRRRSLFIGKLLYFLIQMRRLWLATKRRLDPSRCGPMTKAVLG